MDTIFTEIVSALARAALATFLSRELYSFTIPLIVVLSYVSLRLLTRNSLYRALPPFLGFKDVWNVLLRGKIRSDRDVRELARLTILGKDVIWISSADAMNDILGSGNGIPVLMGKGGLLVCQDKDEMALEKVWKDVPYRGLSFLLMRIECYGVGFFGKESCVVP